MAALKMFPAVQTGILRFAETSQPPARAFLRSQFASLKAHGQEVLAQAQPERFAVGAHVHAKEKTCRGPRLDAGGGVVLARHRQDQPVAAKTPQRFWIRSDRMHAFCQTFDVD